MAMQLPIGRERRHGQGGEFDSVSVESNAIRTVEEARADGQVEGHQVADD
jgi:hypothetical protein